MGRSFASLLLFGSVLACGSSGNAETVDAGHNDSGRPTVDAAKDTAPAKTTDAGKDSNKPVAEAGHADAGADTAAPMNDAALDSAGDTHIDIPLEGGFGVGVDGGSQPITGITANQWTWVPFPDAHCRDGSSTGIGVNFNPSSTKLMIFLEGGGACFDAITCGENPPRFAEPDFDAWFGVVDGTGGGGDGILDRTNSANPLQEWNYVYVPYCTGDVHGGKNPAGSVPDVMGTQAFVGYVNMDLYLQRLVPTFASTVTQVLLTGVSAGGFGAGANYIHVQRAFGSVPVDLIDDSGPFMENPYMPTCFQTMVRTLWNLDATVGVDCAGDCDSTPTFFLDFVKHIAKTYPARQISLMDSLDDGTITSFFGFGADDCTSYDPETAAVFTAGLDDIRTQLASDPNFGSFYFTGTDHTSLESPLYYTRLAGTVPLTTWVGQLVNGTSSNAGP